MALPRCWLDAGPVMLLDRLTERAALGQLLEAARGGRSGALVVHGEAGVGKTALLEDAIGSAAGLRVARVAGVESEVELAFAAREPGEEFRGLPELLVGGLGEGDARELLGSVIGGPLDERVRDRIVAETRGNPLALL